MPLTQQKLAELYERVKADPGAVTGALPPREDAMVSTLIFVVKKALEQRDKTITALSGRVQVLEAREQSEHRRLEQLEAKALHFRGGWTADTDYATGDLVEHSGSVWHCKVPTTGVAPSTLGIATSGWAMFCSRGRQGRSGDAS